MATLVELQATNADILDAIRNEGTSAYQQRIPEATQGNIASAIAALQMYRPQMNEFVDALMNRIGTVVIQSRIWANPLAQFKRGMMNYGDTIEEVYTNLLRSNRFDPNSSHEDVFKKSKPDIKSAYHKIDRQDQYPVTIEDKMLRRAFQSETGLQTLVGSVLQAPYNSDYYDEYLIMRELLTEFAKNGQFFKVQIPDFHTSNDRAADLKYAIELMKSTANRFQFMSSLYNPAGVTTFTPADEIVVFISADFDAAVEVEVLAAAFNMSKAEYLGRRVLIDDFGVEGCQAIVADKNLFMCADTLIDFGSIYNPKALGWNYFLNHHGVYSLSRFMNAVMFTFDVGSTEVTDVITLTDLVTSIDSSESATYVERGGELLLSAVVSGTSESGTAEIPQSVAWAIIGSNQPTALGTFVDAQGMLHVDPHEPNTWLTISATTVYVDPNTLLSEQSALVDTITIGIGGLPDISVPDAPVITEASVANGITGTGEAAAKVTITNTDTGRNTTVTVDAAGDWSSTASLGMEIGHTIVAFQVDTAGNQSPNSEEATAVA